MSQEGTKKAKSVLGNLHGIEVKPLSQDERSP